MAKKLKIEEKIKLPGRVKEYIRNRMYEHVEPHLDYYDGIQALLGNKDYYKENWTPPTNPTDPSMAAARLIEDEIYAKYLEIPRELQHYQGHTLLKKSSYAPTKKSSNEDTYYSFPIGENYKEWMIKEALSELPIGENKTSRILADYNLGKHTLGRGIDPQRGEYISYYDRWDLNPFIGTSKIPSKLADKLGLTSDSERDLSFGVGTPVNLYDRIYLNDYYNLPLESVAPEGDDYYGGYLPEATVTKWSNRKGTGKPETTVEFAYADGGQLQSPKQYKDLSLRERAAIIKTAVRNGYRRLPDIVDAYNKFAEGGPKESWLTTAGNYIKNNAKLLAQQMPIYNLFTLGTFFPSTEEPSEVIEESVGLPSPILPKPVVSDEELADSYINNVVWTMENPTNKGYDEKTGLYSMYTDKGKDGIVRKNFGPGMEEGAFKDKLDYTKLYTRELLEEVLRPEILKRIKGMRANLGSMQKGRYKGVSDTLSMGPLLGLLDINYNVKTTGKKNMPEKWPSFVDAIATGNLERAKEESHSGSRRRLQMRNDLLTYKPITKDTVKNR